MVRQQRLNIVIGHFIVFDTGGRRHHGKTDYGAHVCVCVCVCVYICIESEDMNKLSVHGKLQKLFIG